MKPELRAEIRRLFYAEHWRVGTIATELQIHRDTVRNAIESHRMGPSPRPIRPTIVDPYKDFIVSVLEKHPKLRATRIYDMVRTRGYAGSVHQVRRYVKKIRPAQRLEAFLRRKTLPGEEGQVDWGHFGKISIGRARRSLSCFVMVLSHSRAMYVRFALDQTLESFLRGHVAAFKALAGAPRIILYDNLKSVVLEREGDHIRFHPSILELAGCYHFAPRPCAPYRANEKGKVERTIQYIRHSFFAARTVTSVEQLNIEVASWIEDIAHNRTCPQDAARRAVHEVFAEEQQSLLQLPEHRFECDLVKPIRSGKTPYVRFDLNDYSIPHQLARKPLTMIVSEHELRLIDEQGELVVSHQRSYDRGQTIEKDEHLDELAIAKARARELRGRNKLENVCPASTRLLEALVERGENVRSHVFKINRLIERYSASEVNEAISEALSKGAVGAEAIAHLVDQKQRSSGRPPKLKTVLPDDPRIQNLRVEPHDLRKYDDLGKKEDSE